jgi:hypothetical protein
MRLGELHARAGDLEEALAAYDEAAGLEGAADRTTALDGLREKLRASIALRDRVRAELQDGTEPQTAEDGLAILETLSRSEGLEGLAIEMATRILCVHPPDSGLASCRTAGLGAGSAVVFASRRYGEDPALAGDHRARALAWLDAASGRLETLIDPGDGDARRASRILVQWLEGEAFFHVRDPTAIARLPEDEREAWTVFWGRVRVALGR